MAENIIKFKIGGSTSRPYYLISTLGNAKVLKQNTNPNKYVLIGNTRIYNSAFCAINNGSQYNLLGFIIVDTSGSNVKVVTSSSSDISNPVDFTTYDNNTTGSGNVFCATPSYSDDAAKTCGYFYNYVETLEVLDGIPVFTDKIEYGNYITNTVIPQSGGAGSGYIGNSSLVSYVSQKKMVGYNIPTSSAGTTKTESVNTNDVNPEPNTPKSGNGHIRIKYIREEVIPSYLSEVGTYLIGRPDNKQHLKTVPKWGNGNYDGSAESQWSWPMSLYHPNTNINSDSIALASFPDGATINIDTTAGINVTYTGFTASRLFFRYGYWRARIGLSWEDPAASTPKGAYWCGYESGNDSQYEPTKNDFTSLDQLFEYIYNHFRHCNVVLNGTTIVTETSE